MQALFLRRQTGKGEKNDFTLSRALGCWDMEGLLPAADLDDPQLRGAPSCLSLPIL